MKIILISTDEVGYQPLGLATVIPFLTDWAEVSVSDRSISLNPISLHYDLIAFSVATFGAISSTVELAKTLRKEGYSNPFIFYNQYAIVQPDTFLLDDACFVINGVYEPVLLNIVKALQEHKSVQSVDFVLSKTNSEAKKLLKLNTFFVPDRSVLPPLSQYVKRKGSIVGNVETMRGCAHGCTYCSVFAAYQKRVIKIPIEIVLADIAQVVKMGAKHITFIDADFFSTGKRGITIIERMHMLFPDLTFDLTMRLDDAIRYREYFPDLKQWGCVEVTTAIEFPVETVLNEIEKKISLADIEEGIQILQKANIEINPTFITFNPWVTMAQIEGLDEFLKDLKLGSTLKLEQAITRLLLFKGSPLLEHEKIKTLCLTDRGTFFDWNHPDQEVDEMYNHRIENTNEVIGMRCCIKG